jgi:hypothetical protein
MVFGRHCSRSDVKDERFAPANGKFTRAASAKSYTMKMNFVPLKISPQFTCYTLVKQHSHSRSVTFPG